MKFSECDPKVRAELVAACKGDVQNARDLYEEITSEGANAAVLAERQRCLSLVQLHKAKGGSDADIADNAMADVNAGTEGVPRSTLQLMSDRRLSFGSPELLPKTTGERITIEPN